MKRYSNLLEVKLLEVKTFLFLYHVTSRKERKRNEGEGSHLVLSEEEGSR